MYLPANWDQKLAELTRGCTDEEKGEVYHRLIVMFGWKGMLDLKQQGRLTDEATIKFMRSMDAEEAKLKKQRAELIKGLDAFKRNTLELGQPVDMWAEEVMKQSGLTM